MNYIVLDLEWNQCPEGKEKENSRILLKSLKSVRFVFSFPLWDSKDSFCRLIRPSVYSSLHHRTREVIALRSMDFEDAEDFSSVISDFFSWCGKIPCSVPGDLPI